MTSSQRSPGELPLWQSMLRTIQDLIEDALSRADIPGDNVRWTERRWDLQDMTASWPKDRPTRNIHAWIMGSWPRFFVEVEGAVWDDDEEKLQRRIRFIPISSPPGIITAGGPTSSPELTISNRDALSDGLAKLAHELKSGFLTNEVSFFPLQPDPRKAGA